MLRLAAHVALLASVACGASPGKPPALTLPRLAAQPGDLVIADVAVVPMDREGAVLAHRTVIVRGDRIVAVEPADRVDVPAGATRVDGAGRWLMPGLADMHVHTFSEHDLTLFVAGGVTTVRVLWGSPQHLAWRAEIARGERLGPSIVTASPIIDGDPPVWPGSIVLTDPAEADRLVGELKAKGYDFLKPYSRLSREAYDALVAAGKKHGLRLGGHVPRAAGLRHVLASRQHTIEHLDGWLPALMPPGVELPTDSSSPAYRAALAQLDEARIPALVQETIAAGTWNCPTLVVLDRNAALDDLPAARERARWLRYVSPAVRFMWNPRLDFRSRKRTAEGYAAMRKANAIRGKIAAALANAGAPLLVGTDAGNPFVVPGESLRDELELLIAAGVPRARALRAATAGAAEHLGLTGRAGVVAAGARADLLLVDADPLAGPLPLVPAGVVLRGRWLPRAELEQKLAAVERAHNEPEPSSRLDGLPPLLAEGPELFRAHYDIVQKDQTIGEERLVASQVAGGRALSAQMVGDFGRTHVELQYRIAPGATSVISKSSTGTLTLDGKIERGMFVATGKDEHGAPLSLSDAVPAGAFIAGPGIAGSFNLAERIADLAVGGKRTVTSIELSTYPRPAIDWLVHDVERKPDAGGARVYAVKTKRPQGPAFESELVLDDRGRVVSQRFGPPLDFGWRLRP